MTTGHEARYYEKKEGKRVQCMLCPHFCSLKPGQIGKCNGKQNIDGKLIAINYAELTTLAIDPIEKKPLYHFHPGSYVISTGPNGCNLSCDFCQNWEISQEIINTIHMSPEKLIEKTKRSGEVIGISYTYTEPLIWFEYAYDCSVLAREQGLVNVYVSNGTINPEPFLELLPYIDAINIDLKSMDPKFYKEYCGSRLEPVLEIIKIAAKKTLLEVTNLLITDLNDSDENIHRIVDFIAELDDEIPLHFSRYSPRHKRKNPPTSVQRLEAARDIAKEKIKYVYLGNVMDTDSLTTRCPDCSTEIVKRSWTGARITNLDGNKCTNCGRKINIIA